MKKCLNTMAAVLISMTCLLPSSLAVYGKDSESNTSPEPSAAANTVVGDNTAESTGDGEEIKAGASDGGETSKPNSAEKEDKSEESLSPEPAASPSPDSSQKDKNADSSTESPDPMPKKAILKVSAVSSASGTFTLTLQNNDGAISKKNDAAAGTLSSDQKTLTITDGLKPGSDELDTLNQYEVNHDGTDAYIFDGWFTDDGTMIYRPYGKNANDGTYWNLDKYVGGKDLTLHAQWVKASVLHYDGNGGTTDYPMPVYIFDPAKSFSLTSNTYVRDGYVFAGWNTAANGTGTAYQDGQNVKLPGNTTLYAQWVPQKQTIDQATNGGTFTIVNMTLKEYRYKITEKNYFPHYVSSVGNGKVYDLSDLQDDLTVTNARVAVVTFDKNADDASGDGILQQAPLNQKVTLNSNPYTRDGYMFAGWNTKADGTGYAYNSKQQYSFGDDITLYAQWVPLKQSEKITYDTNKTDSTWTKVSSGSLIVPSDSSSYSAKIYENDPDYYESSNDSSNPAEIKDDEVTITNKNVTSSLTIENRVTGNLGSRDKPFKFTVKMTKGADHPITGDQLAVTINGKKQDLSFDDKGQMELSLKSGDKAVITPLYNGTSYSITESDYKQDGYELTDKSTSGVLSSDTTAIFTNNRAAGIPTGLFDIFGKLWWIVPIAAVAMAIGIYIKHRSMAGKHCELLGH